MKIEGGVASVFRSLIRVIRAIRGEEIFRLMMAIGEAGLNAAGVGYIGDVVEITSAARAEWPISRLS